MKKNVTFSVTGMHCQSCEILIKDELTALPGISDVIVSHKTGKGSVTFLDEKVTHTDILDGITRAGYTGVIDNTDDTQDINNTIDIIKKETASKNPMRVLFQEHITADGEVKENENGKLSFQGKVDNKKNVEVVIPKGKEVEAEDYINRFLKSQNFMHLLDRVDVSRKELV